ncbi:MAG TPA: hypothetical protein VF037_09050 [Gemmatimonadales bacterium]
MIRFGWALLLLAPATGAAQAAPGAPLEARRTGVFAERGLDESSGLAASRAHRGVLWTVEDSGNEAEIHAIDTAGAVLGTWRVKGARNRDWEAVSVGPCGDRTCVYIADTGDNAERRDSVMLYRVVEPARLVGGELEVDGALALEYPGGARDVESLAALPDGGQLLVSKGRKGPVEAFRVPASAWRARAAVAEPLGAIELPDAGLAGLVTDAALHPDGHTLVVRTYASLHFFRIGERGAPAPVPGVPPCGILGLELQGEGVTWLDEGTLALSGEAAYGMPGTVSVVRCPWR